MGFLQMFIVAIFVITSIVLIFFILIQSGKGGSLGIMGGASNTPFGSSTVDVVEKITWWGILIFFILSIISAILFAVPRKVPVVDQNPSQTIPQPNPETENK
ncbi:MAG: preprotein translocase subunit SecG [Leptospiraceae bacterium]|jgi:protein translocase SecG subunit|nr:preprotein translocase subunit SecG [Leptospiraceae bacterium]